MRLRGDPLFGEFSESDLIQLEPLLIERDFVSGDIIFQEGTQGQSFFILEKGSIDILKRNANGEQPRIATLSSTTVFGELALTGQASRSAEAVAREETRIYEIPYNSLSQLVASNPALGVKVYRFISRCMVDKIYKTNDDLLSLIFSARMAAVGEMAGGIAHEIANPLSILKLHSDALGEFAKNGSSRLGTTDRDAIQRHVQGIRQMVERVRKLIRSVTALSRDAERDPWVEVDAQEILDQTIELCKARFKDNAVELHYETDGQSRLDCQPIQISQILLNLMNNAFDAIKGFTERWVRVKIQKKGEFVEFTVTDSGHGIPEQMRERIFQSFFTTKSAGNGTGLGLSIAMKIVKAHRGTIAVNKDSPNTQFVVRLPVKQASV